MDPRESHKHQKWCNEKEIRLYPVPTYEKSKKYYICKEVQGKGYVGKKVFGEETKGSDVSVWEQIRELYKLIYYKENMELTGIVVRVLDTKETGANDFKTRNIHIRTEEQYPQTLEVQFTQGNVSLLDTIKPDKRVRITVNLEGREWVNPEGQTLVFNTIKGWKIEKLN